MILDYLNVWNPSQQYLIHQLENVQRIFTKRVTSINDVRYLSIRLGMLGL